MTNKILHARIMARSGTAEEFTTANPVLMKGEPGVELDTGKLKFGDGATAWNDLSYFMGDIEGELAKYMLASVYKGTKAGYVAKAEVADKLTKSVNINGVAFDGSSSITIVDSTKIPASQKGQANGVATLDSSGQVPSSQLPSFVDDVIEGYYYNGNFYKEAAHTTKINGEGGKIYVDITDGADTKYAEYRWSGTAFISISNPLDIATESEATAGTDNTKAMTPLRVEQAIVNKNYEPAFSKNTAFNKNFGTSVSALTAGASESAGTSNDVARADHVHKMPSSMPPSGSAGGDLTGSYPNPTIGSGKITDAKIANNALSTSKLFVPDGDVLIIDGNLS